MSELITTNILRDKNGVSVQLSSIKGDTGATPNLTIGTVTTLSAGSNATAEITGTAENPVLNLGIPKGADGGSTGGTTSEWEQVTGKPSTFPPEAHSHAQSEVNGLTDALAGMAPASHSHAYSEITDKPSAFPPETHGHAYSEITGTPVFAYDSETQTLTITTT